MVGAVRLDKFMKVSRLSKRRSEAHEALWFEMFKSGRIPVAATKPAPNAT